MERFVLVMCQALGNWIEAAESDFENVFQVSADQPPGDSHHDDASHDDDDDDDDSDTLTLCDEADEFGDVLLETLDTDTETDAPVVVPQIRSVAWYLYQMVSQKQVCMYEGKSLI